MVIPEILEIVIDMALNFLWHDNLIRLNIALNKNNKTWI